jgi:hypothetical protein
MRRRHCRRTLNQSRATPQCPMRRVERTLHVVRAKSTGDEDVPSRRATARSSRRWPGRSRRDRQLMVTACGAEAIPLATTTSWLAPVGVAWVTKKLVEDATPAPTEWEVIEDVRA